jgi:hypothetical protein
LQNGQSVANKVVKQGVHVDQDLREESLRDQDPREERLKDQDLRGKSLKDLVEIRKAVQPLRSNN